MIRLLDLPALHAPIQADLDSALRRVLQEGAFIQGPDVEAFANELGHYLGDAHVVPCANGTDALTLAFLALDLQPGDEVIVPAFTYVATAEAAALLGVRVVLADVCADTCNLDPAAVAAALTERTRAVVPVHLFGQCANLDGLLDVAVRHGLAVVEDTAQALGATYTFLDGAREYAGLAGTVGTTSFFPSKNLGALGDGGALLTRDEALAQRMHEVANHGQPRGVKYRHERVGLNSRLDTLQAALLRVKLRQLDRWTIRRQQIAAAYDAGLATVPGLLPPARDVRSTHVFHQYVVHVVEGAARRAELQDFLRACGIPSAIYYPLPLHRQPVYQHLGRPGQFPVSEALCEQVLALPIHPTLTDDEVARVIKALHDFAS